MTANVGFLLLGTIGLADLDRPTRPSYHEDIAPIIVAKCAVCHHDTGSAPFALIDYRSVRRRARQIVQLTEAGIMPPFKPRRGHGDFRDHHRLDAAERFLLRRWSEIGTPSGNEAHTPEVPEFVAGWQLGKPDVILTLPERYSIPAEGADVVVHFVFRVPLRASIHLRGLECLSENPKVVGHAVVFVDAGGAARELEAGEPGLGYRRAGGPGFVPQAMLPGYVPGQPVRFLPPGVALTLEPGTDLVLQMHYRPTGKPELDQPRLGLHLRATEPDQDILAVTLAQENFVIPPDEDDFLLVDQFTIPVDLKIWGIRPHMQQLGKKARVRAELPDGSTREMLLIDDWDFRRSVPYNYNEPIELPTGSVIRVEWRFDNSAENPFNPFRPPRPIRFGGTRNDEHPLLWLIVTTVRDRDTALLRTANIRHSRNLTGDPPPSRPRD